MKLIGEGRAIFASVFCLLSFAFLAPSVQATEYNWTRKVVATEPDPQKPEEVQSPYVLEEYKTYTAAPRMEKGATGYGAAFSVKEGATLTGTNVTFVGNKTKEGFGGAIYSKGSVTLKDTVFRNNTASSGGAIRVQSAKATATLDGVTFEGNSAEWDGAVYNSGTIVIAGRVELKTASDAWCNKPNSTVSWDLTRGLEHYGTLVNFQLFTNYNEKVAQKILIADDQQAGDYVIASGDFSKVKKAYTENFSITNVLGGAGLPVTINGDAVTTADKLSVYKLVTEEAGETTNLVFKITKYTCLREEVTTENSPYVLEEGKTYTAEPTTKKGGAFSVSSGATLTGTNVTFAGNSAGDEGGAIYNTGKIAFDGACGFSDNVSVKDGGAISTGGEVTFAGAATFERNSGHFGGAIANAGVLTFAARATFTDNKTTGDSNAGGAIENFGGIITFNDVAVFSGNSADSGGAIYNENNDDPVTIGVIKFAGLMDLQTAGDTWYNAEKTIVNWDLTGGLEQYGCISHFERYANENETVMQLISVTDGQPVGDYVIATGDLADVKNKNTFSITNVAGGAALTDVKIDGAEVTDGETFYKLFLEEAGTTTNLVLKVFVPTEPIVTTELTASDNATLAVYTNGVLSAETEESSGVWHAWSNQTATVVYAANAGYVFADGATVVTNILNTKVDPAVIKAGEVVPGAAGKPTLELGVVAQRYPWNGTVDVGYKATYWPAGKKAAVEVTVGETVTTNEFAIAGQGAVTGTAAVPMPAETKGKATFKAIVED